MRQKRLFNNRAYKWLAAIWTLLVMLMIGHQFMLWPNINLDTNLLALLPEKVSNPELTVITKKLTEETATQILIIVGTENWDNTKKAASIFSNAMVLPQLEVKPVQYHQFDELIQFYRPWRNRLLTSTQVNLLTEASDDDLAHFALSQLYQPTSNRLVSVHEDPLQLWQTWWSERAKETPFTLRENALWMHTHDKDWILLSYQTKQMAFSASGQSPITHTINEAKLAIKKQFPSAEVIVTGIPLYVEAAASTANTEINTIGLGSLLAVIGLVWLCFRAFNPILLISTSLLIGCMAGLSVTSMLFERVHIITLIFGASLVGVAEDYGFHYFTARQGRPIAERWDVLNNILPGLLLALFTSAIAYLALGTAPFPGLRQMATFSVTGLCAAFLTVWCWFPFLDRHALSETPFSVKFSKYLDRWPYWRSNLITWISTIILGVITIIGIIKIQSRDDLRQLQVAPKDLAEQQKLMNQLLNLPSPTQFFLIEGKNEEQVLQNEELLKSQLDQVIKNKQLLGYQAVSDWIPSTALQYSNANLTAQREKKIITTLSNQLDNSLYQHDFSDQPLTMNAWLQSPIPRQVKSLWIGKFNQRYYSVVLLRGLDYQSLSQFELIAQSLPSVRWIDKTTEISSIMKHYRILMSQLLILGYVLVFIILTCRFRKEAWRAILPTALGSVTTIGILGLIGEPIQLFNVLALILLLGMGVDYGIFLLEHPNDGKAWLAVALAGISTLLSFGLLGLSSTPALHSFGLTMLIGEVIIWIFTPYLRYRPQTQ